MGRPHKKALPDTPEIVHVVWQDTYALEDQWIPSNPPIERRLIRTIGFKLTENNEYLVVASTYDPTSDTYGSAIAIHKPCVINSSTITGQ